MENFQPIAVVPKAKQKEEEEEKTCWNERGQVNTIQELNRNQQIHI